MNDYTNSYDELTQGSLTNQEVLNQIRMKEKQV